jgi:hypothetical protein
MKLEAWGLKTQSIILFNIPATDTGKASVPATAKSFPPLPCSRKHTPEASVIAIMPKKAACMGSTGSAASPAAGCLSL